MTVNELKTFLNTSKTINSSSSTGLGIPTKTSGSLAMVLCLGIATVAVGYAVYLHLEYKRLKESAAKSS
jgi:hypothetical protein